jgi:hypothetical protein
MVHRLALLVHTYIYTYIYIPLKATSRYVLPSAQCLRTWPCRVVSRHVIRSSLHYTPMASIQPAQPPAQALGAALGEASSSDSSDCVTPCQPISTRHPRFPHTLCSTAFRPERHHAEALVINHMTTTATGYLATHTMHTGVAAARTDDKTAGRPGHACTWLRWETPTFPTQ